MQTNITISKDLLNWVVTQIKIDLLPNQISEYITTWLSGVKTPTFNQIEKVSKATGIPLGYFFLQTPPVEDLSLIDYRTIDSMELTNPSRNLIDTMHDMEQIQEWMKDYLVALGSEPLQFVGAMKGEVSTDRFAQFVREMLGIAPNWFEKVNSAEQAFNKMRMSISASGIIVMMSGIVGNNTHRPLSIDEFRAFALVDNYAPLVFINTNDSINGRLFSLLHEVAHICMGQNSLFNDRYSSGGRVKKAETLCNATAAEILVPQAIFIQKWNECTENNAEQRIEELSQYFRCGITVIARKALDNNFINAALYQKIAQKAIMMYNEKRRRNKERGEGGGDYYRTAASRIDRRFLKMLAGSVSEGRTLYTDAFRLTNTNRSTFANLIEAVGGGGK